QGILLPKIKKAFEANPAAFHGDYYPWLLRNEYVLDRSQPIPLPNSPVNDMHIFLRSGWNYATDDHPATDEVIRKTIASWPPRKQECVVFCGILLQSYSPTPDLPLWLRFGFCVRQDAEMEIAAMYLRLLHCASFDEFYWAYQNAQLVELLERKGLTQSSAYRRFKDEFKDVVDGAAKDLLKSSWHLKEFVQNNPILLGPESGQHIAKPAHVDYGWVNCKGTEDSNRLLHIYREYFNSPVANCLELHSACVSGNLVGYFSSTRFVWNGNGSTWGGLSFCSRSLHGIGTGPPSL
ncbi:hypothetical protein BKA70DRAFT_1119861, partial [Coprinopsis sp. MPI-PUGE-AT-0042]